MASAFSMPSAAQVLAIPLLHTMARAVPFSRCRFVTVRGAPLTKFRVYTAAAAAGRSEKIRARSFLLRFFRMPQWIPAAEKPLAAVTPPSMKVDMGISSCVSLAGGCGGCRISAG